MALGALIYWQYLRFVVNHPLFLTIYVGVFIWISIYIGLLFESMGQTLPVRVLHIGLLIPPAVILLIKNFGYLYKNYNYFKYLVFFFVVYFLYFIFFNYNFVEPFIALRSSASISQVKLHDDFYVFIGTVFLAIAFHKAQTPEAKFSLFKKINIFLVVFALIHSLLILFGYPLNLFTAVIEGFKRSIGLTYHPNELGKIQGLLLTYFIGIYYYYCRLENNSLLKDRLLIGITIVTNILAFLLSLSKNGFLSFGVGCVIFFGLSLFDPKLRSRILQPIIIFSVLMLLILVGYQVYTGNDLLSTVTDRFNDTRSLQWRYSVWTYLLGNIDNHTLWTGHGLTASNVELYRFLFDTSKESKGQSVFVHNAFIYFLYDMGVWGLMVFGSFISAIIFSIKQYLKTRQPLYLTVICLCMFTVLSSCMDECITELNSSLLTWYLVSLIYSLFIMPPQPPPQSKFAPCPENPNEPE